MSPKSSAEQALELLNEALDRLDQLRNAQPRDAAFKQWRQSTLTTLQRVWKDDPTRAERFRRVPFSPVSNKASERATRDAHDAGCREARKLLKVWIGEIELNGLTDAAEGAAPGKIPTAEATEKVPELEFEIEKPVRIESAPQAERPKKSTVRGKKQTLKSMLEFDNLPESDDGLDLSLQEAAQPMPDAAPVARAISAVVFELPRLDVPEESHDFLRGALLDIANRIEFDQLKWETLQELVFLAMQHPAIGRRILPLIVPYLDKAA